MNRGLPRGMVMTGVVAGVLSVTGCSASQPGSGRPGPAVVSAQAQNPVELITQAQAGLEEVLAYEATGTLVLGGRQVAVDLVVAYPGGHGTITVDGVTAVLDYVALNAPEGTSGLFITAPAAYWEHAGASTADAARYADKQVSVPERSDFADAALLLDQRNLGRLIFSAAGTVSSPSVLATPPVDGQPAWIVDYGGDHTTRLTMMANAQQFPLRLVSPHATLTFGNFGKEPHVDSPTSIELSLPS